MTDSPKPQHLRPSVLVVDDTPDNISIIGALLRDQYRVKVANNGERALAIAAADRPDVILLDVMMPGMDGYEVCRRLKAQGETRDIPVIFLTAKTGTEDERLGFELGAVDYIAKPVCAPILMARVLTHVTLRRATIELADWNRTLAQRVAEGVAEVDRLSRLRRFFSPAVADLLLTGDVDDPLVPRRREIVVVFLDLRGYTAFTEAYGADEVMRVLGEFHAAMGEVIMAYGGTLERFAGDGLMIFFNDPIEIPDPANTALRMAIDMQARFADLQALWQTRGYALSMGIGIAQGVATIGAIGFEGRRDYGAIGGVTNLAARLCGEARGGQILVSETAARNSGDSVDLQPVGALALKGFSNPVETFEVVVRG